MLKKEYLLILCLIGCLNASNYVEIANSSYSSEDDAMDIDIESEMLNEESPKKGTTIYDMVPPEIMYLFLENMDLTTMGKTIAMNKKMIEDYLEAFRKRFVSAILAFREKIRNHDVNPTLVDGFKEVIDACKFIKNEPDIINSVRFIFLCKFIASLKPINNKELLDTINKSLDGVMCDHATKLSNENENDNVKGFITALSVYDYSSYARFLRKQGLQENNRNVFLGFLMLIKNSRNHMRNKFPKELMFAYALIRNQIIVRNMLQLNQKLIMANDTVSKRERFKVPLIPFSSELGQSPVAFEKYQLNLIKNTKKSIDACNRNKEIKTNPSKMNSLLSDIFCTVYQLSQNKRKKNELIRKANVNLAMFELIGKNDGPIGKNIRFLSNELKKLYADTDFANTGLEQQIKQLDQFQGSQLYKGDDDCYIGLLADAELLTHEGLQWRITRKRVNYHLQLLETFRRAAQAAAEPNGLKVYKDALEIFRNFGCNSNADLTLIMYYGLFALVSDPKLFDTANFAELKEVNRLHNESFYESIPNLKNKKASNVFNFEELLDKLFLNFGGFISESSKEPMFNTRSTADVSFKREFLLKCAVCLGNEVYGIDIPRLRTRQLRIKYHAYARRSNDHLRKAQQQVFDIMKFAYVSATYNSADMLQDNYLIEEFHYFTLALNGDIVHMFLTSQDEAFYWLHNQIDDKSPACNSMFYLVQLYVARCIKMQLTQNDLDPHIERKAPEYFVENLMYLHLKFFENNPPAACTGGTVVGGLAYECFMNELMELAKNRDNSVFVEFIRIALDYIMKSFTAPRFLESKALTRSHILMKIFEAIQAIPTVEKTEEMLTNRLITKLDHTSFGFYCEAPEQFERVKDAYHQFRVRFGLERVSRKSEEGNR